MNDLRIVVSRRMIHYLRCGVSALIAILFCLSAPAAPRPAPHSTIVDRGALDAIRTRAKETGSDSVIIYQNGVKLLDYHSSKPLEPVYIMSATKSVVALIVGIAIAEGKIKGIDEPVYDYYPELNQGRKKLITIRRLLSMTAGLQHTGEGLEVYGAPDAVKMALAAEVQSTPGSAFSYNNKSVNLLAGIIRIATGKPIDTYAEEKLFDRMGFGVWRWEHDDAGTPYAFADLALLPQNFAKIGRLVLQRGQWQGKQLVPAGWIDQLGVQSQPYEPSYGLLWWRLSNSSSGMVTRKHLDELLAGGVDPKLIAQLRPLVGKPIHSMPEWHHSLATAVPDWEARTTVPGLIGPYGEDIPTWHYDSFDGLSAEGSLGQYLVVFPKLGLVAIRQIEPFDGFEFIRNRFEEFPDMVRRVVPAAPSPTTTMH